MLTLTGCGAKEEEVPQSSFVEYSSLHVISPGNNPPYIGEPYTEMNGNSPQFTYEEVDEAGYETYTELDEMGRVQVAQAYVTADMLPEEGTDLKNSTQVTPSGWKNKSYKKLGIESLYQRVNLIPAGLTGSVDNELNIFSGTGYYIENVKPFQDAVIAYVRETGNDVLYRATPQYNEDCIVPHAIQIEAYSLADQAESVGFNVFMYNVQPGVEIDYTTGASKKEAVEEEAE